MSEMMKHWISSILLTDIYAIDGMGVFMTSLKFTSKKIITHSSWMFILHVCFWDISINILITWWWCRLSLRILISHIAFIFIIDMCIYFCVSSSVIKFFSPCFSFIDYFLFPFFTLFSRKNSLKFHSQTFSTFKLPINFFFYFFVVIPHNRYFKLHVFLSLISDIFDSLEFILFIFVCCCCCYHWFDISRIFCFLFLEKKALFLMQQNYRNWIANWNVTFFGRCIIHDWNIYVFVDRTHLD